MGFCNSHKETLEWYGLNNIKKDTVIVFKQRCCVINQENGYEEVVEAGTFGIINGLYIETSHDKNAAKCTLIFTFPSAVAPIPYKIDIELSDDTNNLDEIFDALNDKDEAVAIRCYCETEKKLREKSKAYESKKEVLLSLSVLSIPLIIAVLVILLKDAPQIEILMILISLIAAVTIIAEYVFATTHIYERTKRGKAEYQELESFFEKIKVMEELSCEKYRRQNIEKEW